MYTRNLNFNVFICLVHERGVFVGNEREKIRVCQCKIQRYICLTSGVCNICPQMYFLSAHLKMFVCVISCCYV